MKVVFRTDSSLKIGTGHVMRCLTLAEQLQTVNANISFICRELPGNISDLIEKNGYKVFRLSYSENKIEPEDNGDYAQWLNVTKDVERKQTSEILMNMKDRIDWLVVDHYALDSEWEKEMRQIVDKIMVIDDLANRPHDCDLLLDQNLYHNHETRYDNLVSSTCKKLLGPEYALLRPEFLKARKSLRNKDGRIRRIFVFFGGSDPTNETTRALKAICSLKRPDLAVDVVVGNTNPHKEQVVKSCLSLPGASYYKQVSNIAELMAEADLSIGAGGTATWERCCLGLPSLVIAVAKNQEETVSCLDNRGAVYYAGKAGLESHHTKNRISSLLHDRLAIVKTSKICLNIVDGRGAERIAGFFNGKL